MAGQGQRVKFRQSRLVSAFSHSQWVLSIFDHPFLEKWENEGAAAEL